MDGEKSPISLEIPLLWMLKLGAPQIVARLAGAGSAIQRVLG